MGFFGKSTAYIRGYVEGLVAIITVTCGAVYGFYYLFGRTPELWISQKTGLGASAASFIVVLGIILASLVPLHYVVFPALRALFRLTSRSSEK